MSSNCPKKVVRLNYFTYWIINRFHFFIFVIKIRGPAPDRDTVKKFERVERSDINTSRKKIDERKEYD